MKMLSGFAMLLCGASTSALAAPIPDAVAAMIDAAAGDPVQLKAVADVAKKTNPNSVAEIDGKVAAIEKSRADAREAQLASQGFFQGWTGSGEAGGFISSGNTQNRGAAVGLTLTKETRKWKHALRGLVDYQEDNGRVSRERYFAGYEGNYNITTDFYALMTLSYERDPFTGFNRRFSESLGLGYKLINSPRLVVAVEGGPALRQTRFVSGLEDNSFAARGAVNAKWIINDNLTLTENATIFYDDFNTSLYSLTALTAKLSGALSARLSFQFNSESNPPPGREDVDTVTRATVVYSF